MAKKPVAPKQKPKPSENIIDYSEHFNSFYDIFVGHQVDPKNFDLHFAVRDARNLFASFINLMDSNAVVMKQKF